MYNNLQMRIFNYIINKLDLRIRKPSQAKPSQAKPSDNFKIFHFPAFFSGRFAIAFLGGLL